MPWNQKHHDFFQKQNMWSGTTNLGCFIYRKCKPNESTELEIDVDQFTRHMKRTKGKAYHRTYFNKMMSQLEEKSNGGIVTLRYYGKGIYKILVRPISFAIENEKSKAESSSRSKAQNPMYSEAHKKRVLEQQQQEEDIEILDSLFEKIGMKYAKNTLLKIWRMAGKKVDEVKTAIEYMLHSNTTQAEPIKKPHGWLISCLKSGWHKNFDHCLEYELPTFKDRLEMQAFINCVLNGDPVPIPSP